MDQSSSDAGAAASRQRAIEDIKRQQNLPLAAAAGAAVAIVAAIAWAAITVVMKMELGIVAIAVGYVVGRAIREVGKGIDPVFGVLGAACALFGCVLGNLFGAIAFYAQGQQIPFPQAFFGLDFALMQRLFVAFFQPMDLLFYGIAIYEGYRFSFKYRAR